MPKIVILGERGQLAQSLGRLAWPEDCRLEFVGRRRQLGPDAIKALSPDLILNAAAYTAVDRAESEQKEAAALNVDLPASLATICKVRDIPLVHVSSDYVFNGRKASPYLEADQPDPVSVYGRTKLEGDRVIERASLRRWAILRTSWVISEIGETFPVKFLRRARQGEPLRVVTDQRGCPTAAADLARAMQVVGLKLLADGGAESGIFNFCGASPMTWHGLADLLLRFAPELGVEQRPIAAIGSGDLHAPAHRPANSVLDCSKIVGAYGISGAPIEADLPRMVGAILSA